MNAKNLSKGVMMCLVLVGICFELAMIQAQNNIPLQPQLVMEGIRPTALDWSDNELKLAFLNSTFFGEGIQLESNEWFEFDVEQQATLRSNRWPLQPNIPNSIENNMEINSLVFVSPGGGYFVYPSQFSLPETREGSFIQIYDVQQNAVLDTGIPSGGITSGVGYIDVVWGTDNTFVLSTIPEDSGIPARPILHYVQVQDRLVLTYLLVNFMFENRSFSVPKVFDISSDGLRVLMAGGFVGEGNAFLAIWNAQTPNELIFVPHSQMPTDEVSDTLDAHFTTFDGSEFVFFNNQGVGHYDVLTEALEIINSQVTSQAYRYAEFSPSAEVLALANESEVYWLDLRDTLVIPTPTSSPSPTPTATYTPTSPPPPAITATPGALAPLRLTSMCSPSPSTYRVWGVWVIRTVLQLVCRTSATQILNGLSVSE